MNGLGVAIVSISVTGVADKQDCVSSGAHPAPVGLLPGGGERIGPARLDERAILVSGGGGGRARASDRLGNATTCNPSPPEHEIRPAPLEP